VSRAGRWIRYSLAAVAIACLAAATGNAGDAFLPAFGDLPLMDGLAPVADSETVFDTPDGRIVEAYAAGTVSRDRAERFYATTLPQLGWRRQTAYVFRREDETLTIEFRQKGKTLTVRFMLAPARR